MQKTYTINGQKMSLSSFGIETMSYLLAPDGEKGVFHIDGDPDDSDTAANADKLRAAIAADPEGVQEFFTSLTNDMYKSLQSKAASSVNSSYGSFYEDKYMNTQYDKYKTALADYEDKLADIEDKYYKQFSRMETALTKLQSSSSAITGLFNY
ncbi:MAG: flagellar filament capping protein FliD [Lachnospiraceae bacterium]|nr:flagellar filament capping protein FliD [Lachnospiraceae bacterium]